MAEITLTNDPRKPIIDDCDADLAQKRWRCHPCRERTHFAFRRRTTGHRGKHVALARLILSRKLGRALLPSEWVDHVNGDTFDNRRCNLRTATPSQNQQNRKPMSGTVSGIKGVYWHKRDKKWCASIRINGVRKHLGSFGDKRTAALAYEVAAKREFGEFACISR